MLDKWRIDWLRVHSKEGEQMPEPVRVPRPHEDDAARAEPTRVSMRDMAKSLMSGRSRRRRR